MNINRTTLSGHLTADPELQRTGSGTDIMRFRLAVNERWKDPKTGEWTDRANYIPCTLFGRRAASLSDMLSKGKKVIVSGKLHWSEWERNGQRRSAIEVIVDDIDLAFSRSESAPAQIQAHTLECEDIPF